MGRETRSETGLQENTETERERQREGEQQIHIQRNTKIQDPPQKSIYIHRDNVERDRDGEAEEERDIYREI